MDILERAVSWTLGFFLGFALGHSAVLYVVEKDCQSQQQVTINHVRYTCEEK